MRTQRLSALLVTGGVCAVLGGCGGSDQASSKPSYCAASADFKQSVSALTDVKPVQNGTSSLTAAVDDVKSSGEQLVSAAKNDFGTEASALNSSITALGATAQQLGDPATRKAALAAVPPEIQSVQTSYDALASAVKTKCD